MKRVIVLAVLVVTLVAFVAAKVVTSDRKTDDRAKADSTTESRRSAQSDTQPIGQLYSLDDPNSPWAVVNKRRPLQPVDYTPVLAEAGVPSRLPASNAEMLVSQQIVKPLQDLVAAANQDGVQLLLVSAFRSYQLQTKVYAAEVASNGQDQADRESARPGHSEHQTGLAVDFGTTTRQCELQACFGDTLEGKWLAANSHMFGFVIRYQPGKENITGYTYEPWHIRFVGKELATEIYRLGNLPLETYFKLGPAASYQ